MQMTRCYNGHYYDPVKHSACPHCGINIDFDMQPTMPKRPGAEEDVQRTTPAAPSPPSRANAAPPEGRTIGMFQKKIGIDPVVGWLVCTQGPHRGSDFRLHSERNFIGRSESMDVTLKNDDAVSRDNHAIVSFDTKKSIFRIYPGDGRGIVYLNEDEVVTGQQLEPYDVIELGQSKLIFIPLCGDKFQWQS